MPTFLPNFITLEKLGMAYRKAKVDLYYAGNGGLTELLKYEENLYDNLGKLHDHLNMDSDSEWFNSEEFLGDWKLVPKGISVPKEIKDGNLTSSVISSDPRHAWTATYDRPSNAFIDLDLELPVAEFRLMAAPSIDFHIVSALWIALVGHHYDKKIETCAYGNRLRRNKEGKVNILSLGSFAPYLWPYREWRDRGISAAKKALDDGKKVVALTADVSSFYHELNSKFMLDIDFKRFINIDLNNDEEILNSLFINSMIAWAERSPLGKGLPVGLPASGLIANMALVELDRFCMKEIVPLYYGRYVDDIILVMEDTSEFKTSQEAWNWIFKRCNNILDWDPDDKKYIRFSPPYLHDSKIQFERNKTKVFLLEGASGKVFVNSLAHQIQARASEWRALPALPEDAEDVAHELVCALQADGEKADNLRKADALSMLRAGFALKLRDYEAYAKDLLPSQWSSHRKAFLNTFTEYTITPISFFDLADYLPRIIRLATSCEDFFELSRLLQRLGQLVETVFRTCMPNVKAAEFLPYDRQFYYEFWVERLKKSVVENIRCSFPISISAQGIKDWEKYMKEQSFISLSPDSKKYVNWQKRFFAHDLAYMPFRTIGLPHEKEKTQLSNLLRPEDFCRFPPANSDEQQDDSGFTQLFDGITSLCNVLENSMDKGLDISVLPYGFLFSTRPFSLTQLYLLFSDPFSEKSVDTILKIIAALRGYSNKGDLPRIEQGHVRIPSERKKGKIKIAVPSWETKISSWNASVKNLPDPDNTRYMRMNHMLNQMLSHPQKPDYVIMPELSMPASWFLRVAHKFHHAGISLIAGVEYVHSKNKKVSNQAWAALSYNGFGFPAMIVCQQEKQVPALHEEDELMNLANVIMRPQRSLGKRRPVIQHGNFNFGILICSELQNIEYRAAFRGKIDALFVPEWNQDTETFNSLVESAAMDIHAYIVQCNNRAYGDSRIRAPYKDGWRRDVVRLKGGTNDFFVIGEIDVQKLREFQSYHRSLYINEDGKKPRYKPVPDGFKISDDRKVLPRS